MSILTRIFEGKRAEVAERRAQVSLEELRARCADLPPTLGFRRALAEFPGTSLIAEVKKASPSQGLIRPDFDPEAIARSYREAGAQALSVLTDGPHFQGSSDYLTVAKTTSGLPVLRKDFIYDAYQVWEARSWGADALLLIVASLEDAQIADLQGQAHELGLDVLVEVHDEAETERALALGCSLIGVNNRDLRTFTTALETSERLIPKIAPHALAVSESAIEANADVERVARAGAKAVLIGTTFCASPVIEEKVREVMGR
jgi:indole-3-glycerol phosphate synthase